MTVTVVLATQNQGKVAEFARALSLPDLALESLAAWPDYAAPEETGTTFRENAHLKALAAARHTGRPALADDSGLCVNALEGAPGIRSSRYAGEDAGDQDNIDLLLERLVDTEDRSAWFACALCLVAPDGTLLWEGEGKCHGTILERQVGTGGFGYDPVFLYPPARASFAQLAGEEKARVSHRGAAINRLRRAWHAGIPGLEPTGGQR